MEVENPAGQYPDLLAAGLKPALLNKREPRWPRRSSRAMGGGLTHARRAGTTSAKISEGSPRRRSTRAFPQRGT